MEQMERASSLEASDAGSAEEVTSVTNSSTQEGELTIQHKEEDAQNRGEKTLNNAFAKCGVRTHTHNFVYRPTYIIV